MGNQMKVVQLLNGKVTHYDTEFNPQVQCNHCSSGKLLNKEVNAQTQIVDWFTAHSKLSPSCR